MELTGAAKMIASYSGDDLASLATAIGQIGLHVDALRERIRLLEAVIENFPGGISLFDSDLQMVLCNEQRRSCWTIPTNSLPTAFRRWKGCFASTPPAANTGREISRNM